MFCRTMVALAPRDQRLYSYVGGEMLQAAIASLASEVGQACLPLPSRFTPP